MGLSAAEKRGNSAPEKLKNILPPGLGRKGEGAQKRGEVERNDFLVGQGYGPDPALMKNQIIDRAPEGVGQLQPQRAVIPGQ